MDGSPFEAFCADAFLKRTGLAAACISISFIIVSVLIDLIGMINWTPYICRLPWKLCPPFILVQGLAQSWCLSSIVHCEVEVGCEARGCCFWFGQVVHVVWLCCCLSLLLLELLPAILFGHDAGLCLCRRVSGSYF